MKKKLVSWFVSATLLLASAPAWAAEEEEVAHKFLGLPVEIWKLANLLLILGFLVYFLGRPFTQHFRKRRGDLDEALDRAAAGLSAATRRNGGDGVGIFSCSKATNEMNFVAQKFARQVLGSNNIDSCNRT